MRVPPYSPTFTHPATCYPLLPTPPPFYGKSYFIGQFAKSNLEKQYITEIKGHCVKISGTIK